MKTNNIFYDEEFRNKIRHSDKELLTTLLTDSMEGIEVKVLTNTQDILYFVIPDNSALGATDTSGIQAAGVIGASTAGSHSTIGTVTSITSSVSSIGSLIGSASSIGCVS